MPTAPPDIQPFSHDLGRPLRPYQLAIARAVLGSIFAHSGLTIAVMIARQGGKNEVSAHLEAFLLTHFRSTGGHIVKAAPTFRPQLVNSRQRLEQLLQLRHGRRAWRSEMSYIVRLGNARVVFLSAQPEACVVGMTAHHLLEFDEAQDIAVDKHDRDFSPMGATTNCTRVYWGTAWTDRTLLQQMVVANDEAERRDGVRRNFRFPWSFVAECVPAYGRYVEQERARLGANHPLFTTQYELKVVADAGSLFNSAQRAILQGDHPRRQSPEYSLSTLGSGDPGYHHYVAAVDIAGEDEAAVDALLRAAQPRRDSTVVLIGAVEQVEIVPGITEPLIRVVDARWWTGRKHSTLFKDLVELLRDVWHVSRVCVDSSGVGAGVASFLVDALGEKICVPVTFTSQAKSALGFALLSAVNAGRLKWWGGLDAECQESAEFWRQIADATYEVKAHETMHWGVPDRLGHDDFVVALSLLVAAANSPAASTPPPAAAIIPPPIDYDDGRY